MYVNNHHNASLAHDFSPLGLLVGIMDQLTGKSTLFLLRPGKYQELQQTIKWTSTEILYRKLLEPLTIGLVIASDIVGSSGSKGRGQGLPAPFGPI